MRLERDRWLDPMTHK